MREGLKKYDKKDSLISIRSMDSQLEDVRTVIEKLIKGLHLFDLSTAQKKILMAIYDDISNAKAVMNDDCRFKLSSITKSEIRRIPQDQLPRYLIYRYRYEMYPKNKTLDDFPPCLQIEPISNCNYRCVFCYQTDRDFTDNSKGHMGTMSLDLFKRIIDQAEGNCEAITLASRGEPLLCKNIETMLAYCRGKFLGLKLNTNASLLDEWKCHAILQAGVSTVVFSMDATTRTLYEKLRVGGRFERVYRNIKRFHEIRKKEYPDSPIISRISGVFVDSSKQDLDEMERFWGEWVDQIAFVTYNPWENVYNNMLNGISEACSDLYRRMFVWFDGSVNPCDVDYKSTLSIGNASKRSLKDLWLSEDYRKLRLAHLQKGRQNRFPCNRCSVV